MPKLRVHAFSISLDGYGAGPKQDRADPLGVAGEALHEWVVATRTFRQMSGKEGGTTGVDDDFAARGFNNIGAWIMGRNMFGPVRGHWPDDTWKGWWGDNPPYLCPVFVLASHPRTSIAMDGGTTFHFVTDGIHAALKRATEVAKDRDIRLGGGVATIRQYLRAALIDEMHLAISPVLLGSGEHLLADIDARSSAIGVPKT
jgi:dihydrofolate reductase